MKPLTKKQAAVVRYMGKFYKEKMYWPTFVETGRALGVASTTVSEHLQRLVDKGYVGASKPNTWRGYFLTDSTMRLLELHNG